MKIEDSPAGKIFVIYNGMFKPHGVVITGYMKGWLVIKHPDGQWVTLANLKKGLDTLIANGVCDVLGGE